MWAVEQQSSATEETQSQAKEAPPEEALPEEKEQAAAAASSSVTDERQEGSGVLTSMPEAVPSTGALSYRIPIEVPPGRLGIAPNLALTYNSQARNSWVGIGWTLDLGSIQVNTRFGTKYDGFVAAINGSTSELVLDASLGAGCYRTKIEGAFSKYCFSSNAWIVYAKDGTKYYYGTDSASRQDDPPNNPVRTFKWCLDEVRDTYGNYMSVTYVKESGEIYPARILYTGNSVASATPINQVDFILDKDLPTPGVRPDKPIMYGPNFQVITGQRLRRIDISANSSAVRKYELIYNSDNASGSPETGNSLLTSVIRYGNDGTVSPLNLGTPFPVNPSFTQAHSSNTFSVSTQTEQGLNPSKSKNWTGDFNGDGRMDIASYVDINTVRVHIAQEDGTFVSDTHSVDFSTFYYFWVADFNGDGLADIANWVAGGTQIKINLAQLDANGNLSFDPHTWTQTEFVALDGVPMIWPGDFNGDGKTDFAAWDAGSSGTSIRMHLSTGSGFTKSNWTSSANYNFMWLGDFDGDGRTDIASRVDATDELTMHLSTGSNFALEDNAIPRWPAYFGSGDGGAPWMWVADFNGDGRADIVSYVPGSEGASAYVNLSTGSSTYKFYRTTWTGTQQKPFYIASPNRTRVGDFNGDGRADILTYSSTTVAHVNLSTGSGWDTRDSYDNTWTAGLDSLMRFYAGDFNGDGKADIVSYSSSTVKKLNISKGPLPDLLVTAENGIGGKATIAYVPSSHYTNNLLPFVVQTVGAIGVDDGNGIGLSNTYTTTYDYLGGFYWHEDREFYGFSYATVTNPIGTRTATYFHQREASGIPNRYKGMPSTQEVTSASNALYTSTSYTYGTVNLLSGAAAFPYLVQKDDDLYDGTETYRRTTTAFEYDSYGNVTLKATTCSSGCTPRYEHTAYVYSTGTWIMDRPHTTYVADDSAILAKTCFGYDNQQECSYSTDHLTASLAHGALKLKGDWNSQGTSPVTSYAYNDAYGYRTSVTDPKNYTTNYAYDDTAKTFVAMVTNPLGQMVDTTWDLRFGKPTAKTLPHTGETHVTTTFDYDVFGRLQKVVQPYDTSESPTVAYAYENFGTIGAQRIKKTLKDGTGNGLWSETYFDGFGRTIAVSRESTDSHPILTTTTYNATGAVEVQAFPCFAQSTANLVCLETPSPYTLFEYDDVGRVITSTVVGDPAAMTTFAYDKGKTTIKDPMHHQKEEFKDIYGRLVMVKEYTGQGSYTLYATTVYTYSVLGNLLNVRDNQGNLTTMAYDSLSRKTAMWDPDMGHWTYAYDLNGNLTSQTDANNHVISFMIDSLNRVQRKCYGAATCTGNTAAPYVGYTYDEPAMGYSVGKLTTATTVGVNNTLDTTTFTYDQRQRPTVMAKTINGAPQPPGGNPYTITTAYDSMDRTTSISHNAGPVSTLYYTYDAAGNLYDVGESGVTHATFDNYTALGQKGRVRYRDVSNPSVTTTYTYDTMNARLDRMVTINRASQTLQDLTYDYFITGQISQITDGVYPYRNTQTFGYDDLSRLTSASGGYGNLAYTYNEIGNMLSSPLGNYTYPSPGSARPHAPLTAGGYTFTYTGDNNGNLMSGMGRSYTWTYDNKPETINSTSFIYDYSGRRIKKQTGNAYTYYIAGSLEYVSADSNYTAYVFAGGTRIAKKAGSNNAYAYYHGDHLKSTSIETNQNGTNTSEFAYKPYGEIWFSSGYAEKYKFTDQEQDSETGLYNYGARHYDPVLARFVSPDTIVPDPADPQTLNRYSYCRNNPVMYVDPSGHLFGIDDIIGAGLLAIASSHTVMHHWLGIDQVSAGAFVGVGGEISVDYTKGVRITRAGIGVGIGGYAQISGGSLDIGGGLGGWATVGYDNSGGVYYSESGSIGPVGYSGTYYFGSGDYSVRAGVGYEAASLSIGYGSAGGWSVSPELMGAYYDTGTKRFGVNVDVADLADTYKSAVGDRKYNGYGPENGGPGYKIVDIIGTIAAGWIASDNHDEGYRFQLGKASVDYRLFTDMIKGSASNLEFQRNGFIKAAVGLAISPIYYMAVAVGGEGAYRAAPKAPQP